MWEFTDNKLVYIQIIDKIKEKIITGEYIVGQRIPSVRELSEQAGVNPNTVQKALLEIEREGYIFSMRTSGKYITDDIEKIEDLKSQTVKSEVEIFVQKMRKLGFDENYLHNLIRRYW